MFYLFRFVLVECEVGCQVVVEVGFAQDAGIDVGGAERIVGRTCCVDVGQGGFVSGLCAVDNRNARNAHGLQVVVVLRRHDSRAVECAQCIGYLPALVVGQRIAGSTEFFDFCSCNILIDSEIGYKIT